MRRLLLASALLAAALAAQSLSVARPASAAKTPNPCVLITNSDASTALGSTPPQAKAKIVAGVLTCTYTVKKKVMTVAATRVASKAAFDKSAKANKGIVVPIQGLSFDAWSANGTKLLVWQNGTAITMTFTGFEPFVSTQQALAKTAVGRL
jgi:hypothetical protein